MTEHAALAADASALFEAFGNPEEELNPELAQYLEDGQFGTYIRHPLVYSLVHHPALNAYVNKQLAQKKAAVEEAYAENQWHSYVFLHERPYRVGAFQDIADEMSDEDYWDLLGEIWCDSENIRQNPDVWFDLLESDRGSREMMMEDDERADLAAMDDVIPVYQGHTDERNDGWSWTTDREKAEWFARRFAMMENANAVLSFGVCRKEDVVAFLSRRGESEIIVPLSLVTINGVQVVKAC